MLRLPRLTLAVLLAATLLTTAALASPLPGAGPRRTATASAPLDLVGRLWDFLTGFWSKNGCSADPNGLCASTPTPTPTSENGCSVDPDGRCLFGSPTTTTAENGCGLDPNGRCGG